MLDVDRPCGLMCRGHGPPAVGDPAVQSFLHRLTPACLPRAILSKGIQHPDALVRYTTLCTLLKLVQTVQSALQTLQTDMHALTAPSAQAQTLDTHSSGLTAPAQHSNPFHDLLEDAGVASAVHAGDAVTAAAAAAFEMLQQQQQLILPFLNDNVQQQQQTLSLHTQWIGFHLQLRQMLRANLPDPQSLLAVLSTLQKSASQAAPEPAPAADVVMHESPHDDSELVLQSAETAFDLMAQQADSAGMESSVTAPELTSTVVLMVLTGYQQCLPEAMSDSHVDVFSLMPHVSLGHDMFMHVIVNTRHSTLHERTSVDSSEEVGRRGEGGGGVGGGGGGGFNPNTQPTALRRL